MKDETSLYGVPPERVDRLLRYGLTPPEDNGETATAPALDRFGEKPGGRIDCYQLLRVLGEGGMGIVYLAQQDEPVKRQVALKVIKPGMDSKRVLARFEAEKQALALMDHPHIARVIDAGLTLSARPYFVMELVKGVPITEHCDTYKLTVEERLCLFLHVCEAVQHAHQKGIIHRDLKPTNILVSIDGNKAIPKIIDFGVARATGQQLTEKTLYTEQGQLIGTPEYMSPEQADLNNQDIDTRTDIYSLGVILYELLAGVPPFDPCTFQDAGIEHRRKVIREEEPKTPSTKLSKTSLEKLSDSARRRGTNAGALQRKLKGDLDWITLKAMEKDRTRRYASAGELAADIRRYLSHELVLASPPSTIYRLSKFVRRHKGLVAGTLLVLAVSLIGTVVSIIFAHGQSRALAEVQAVSDFLRHSVLASLDPFEVGGREITTRSILDATSKSLEEEFKGTLLAEAEIRDTLGNAYWSLGLYKTAESHLKRALDIQHAQRGAAHPATLGSTHMLGWVCFAQSRYGEAEQHLLQAHQTRDRLWGDEHPDTLLSLMGLACVYNMQGRFQDAEQLARKGLETARSALGREHSHVMGFINVLAWNYDLQGRYKEADRLVEKGLKISRQVLGENHWFTLLLKQTFGQTCVLLGRYGQAERHLLDTLDVRREAWGQAHPDTLETMGSLGWLYYAQGLYKQAESQFTEVRETSLRVLGDAHFITAECLHGHGTLYLSQGRYDEAEALLERALEITDQILGEENWATLRIMNKMAKLYTVQGRYEEAEQLFEMTLKAQRRILGDEHPDTLTSINNFAVLSTKQKQYNKAVSLFEEAWEGRKRRLGEDHPDRLETTNDFGMLYKEQGHYDKAESLLLKTLESRRLKLGDTHPHTIESWKNLIDLYEAWNKPEKAEEWRAERAQTERTGK
ncbi:tetratricopeptide repeat protein [Planctomycetota bacterium]